MQTVGRLRLSQNETKTIAAPSSDRPETVRPLNIMSTTNVSGTVRALARIILTGPTSVTPI